MTGRRASSDGADRVRAVKARVSLVAVIGQAVKLTKKGHEFLGLCPFHSETTPSFTVSPDKDFYHCFGCGAHGDVIGFVMAHDGKTFPDALAHLESDAGLAEASAMRRASVRAEPARDNGFVDSLEAAQAVWRAAYPLRGELPETYLAARGIDLSQWNLRDAIRFHPRCPTALWRRWEKLDDVRRVAPAMLCAIMTVTGGPGARVLTQIGTHVTWLAPDGKSKAQFDPWQDRTGKWHQRPSRKIWGEAGGGAVLLPRAGMTAHAMLDSTAMGPLVVGEGLESSLSLGARHSERGAVATLSLNNLQGRALTGPQGDIDLWQVMPDPACPPFVIDQPGSVIIGVDADMKGLKNRLVRERVRGPLVRRDLTGAERTNICAQLAGRAWRAAGADPVQVLRPPMGHDFNDLDQEMVA